MGKEIPDYLYHYTNLGALALILKGQSIRLNSLKNMDDLEEYKAGDLKEFGKYCFISSWTDDQEEKLSLWNMYTDMKGVRIKLHTLPFETYTWSYNKDGVSVDLQDSFWEKKNVVEDCYPVPFENDKFVLKVEYTDDEEKIYPKLLEYNAEKDETVIKSSLLGQYKRKEWEFQDEVRYRMIYFPIQVGNKDNYELIKENIRKQVDLPFQHRYLKIKKQYFDEIEITMGPKMTTGECEIVKLLVEKFCPTATIKESKFKDKIR